MMKFKSFILGLVMVSAACAVHAQTATRNAAPAASQPKIIVGMMVDQMRWDYLYRFQNRYTEGGFKRLVREGFSCENTLIILLPLLPAGIPVYTRVLFLRCMVL